MVCLTGEIRRSKRKTGGIYTDSEAGVEGNDATPAAADLIDASGHRGASAGPGERPLTARQLVDMALIADNPKAVARAFRSLKPLLPLGPRLERALDHRILALVARGTAGKDPELAEAIALFMYGRTRVQANAARPYIPALLSFLSQNVETTGAYAYYALMIAASEAPDCFRLHAPALLKALDSPGIAERAFAMRIIAVLAARRPAYVAGARETLMRLSEDASSDILKAEAAEAYRVITSPPAVPDGPESALEDDPALAKLFEMPVWQQAIENHLSTAYEGESLTLGRRYQRRLVRKRRKPQWKNGRINEYFADVVQELGVSGEAAPAPAGGLPSKVSLDDSMALLSPGISSQIKPVELPPMEAPEPSLPPVAEVTLTAAEESAIEAIVASNVLDATETGNLQDMMSEVQNEFSEKAGGILDALGMGHLMRGGAGKAEDGDQKMSAKEFVASMEKLIVRKKIKKYHAPGPDSPEDSEAHP